MKLPLRIPRKRTRRIAAFAGLTLLAAIVIGATFLYFSSRPSLLDDIPFSTAYYDRDGKLLRLSLATDDKYRLFTPLEKISPDLVTATLTQEDRHFYSHPGVNPLSMMRAVFETYIKRSRTMGGSTIAMQVVRLRDGLGTRSLHGKIVQIARALQLERHYAKDRILEAYLNLAPYGGNIHGAEAASLIYFRQPAKNLAMPQSLALAVIPQNPVKRSPLNSNKTAWNAARLRLFERLPESYRTYRQQVGLPLSTASRDDLPFLAPHFIDGLETALPGHINTTLDIRLQKTLETRISSWLARERERGLDNAAAMLVHVPTMEVRALIGSGDFFTESTDGQVDGTAAARSPGSTLKPFVYALALDQGLIHPETLLADDPAYFAEYRPGNFDDRFIGMIPAGEALALSRNVPAIALAARLREPGLYRFLQAAGANLPRDESHYGLSIVVGGAETDMRTITRLYAMLANGGVLRDLKYTKEQVTPEPRSVLSPEAAFLTLTMLDRPEPGMLPFASPESFLPVYWKTGTSSGFRDAWTVGVFGPYVLAVWTGHFDGRPSPALIGAEAAAPLFFELVHAVSKKEDLEDLIGPAMKRLNLDRVDICRETGTPGPCGYAHKGWFIPGKSPISSPGGREKKPEILSPRAGLSYVVSRKSAEPLNIPLEAANTDDKGRVYWFDDNRLIGTAEDNATLFWTPGPGIHAIRYLDSQGRSAVQKITVIASE